MPVDFFVVDNIHCGVSSQVGSFNAAQSNSLGRLNDTCLLVKLRRVTDSHLERLLATVTTNANELPFRDTNKEGEFCSYLTDNPLCREHLEAPDVLCDDLETPVDLLGQPPTSAHG